MNGVCIFLGPTLALPRARAELDASYLPPVSQGDVYRLWLQRPRAIGIVDGHFEHVPGVLHKEIMWVMERGVHVFGSASAGALRAVELETFGMRGSGWVYEAFKDGTLEQDDEIAITHERGPDGYRALSESMVNIRRTLLAARRKKVISQGAHDLLTAAAKDRFYHDRNWPGLLEAGEANGADPAGLRALREWLPEGRVDQQADDALAMLREMRGFLASDPAPLRVRWRTANTTVWDAARRQAARMSPGEASDPAVEFETVMDEIRLLGPAFFEDARRRSLLRLFAAAAAEREGATADGERLREAVGEFRAEHGLEQAAELAGFLAANELSMHEFERLIGAEDSVRRACRRAEADALDDLIDDLRVRGEYGRLVSRARDKARQLRRRGAQGTTPAKLGQSEHDVLRWYFADRLGTAVPADLSGYARMSGFSDEVAFRRAAWHEFCYLAGGPK